MFNLFKSKSIIIDIKLHCPDGFDESLGFTLPEEIDRFLVYINAMSKLKGYSFTAKKTSTLEQFAKLKESIK